MPTVNFGAKSLGVIDEKFTTESVTDDITDKGITLSFEGVNTVTIYQVATVNEVDYVRNGPNRFGPLVELPTGVQTFTLTQDKSATWTIDRGNFNDQMMTTEAKKSMARQIREKAVPATDRYRLATLVAYAVAQGYSATAVLTNTTSYAALTAGLAGLQDREVPMDGIVAFYKPSTFYLLKRDPEYKLQADTAYRDVKTGVMSEVEGVKIKRVPSSYLPATTNFLLVHEKTLISPVKMKLARILDEVQGIDGWVAEYRRYYDAFIATNKGVATFVHKSS